MTPNDVNRAQLAITAARLAGEGAALEQMKAIAYCLRNQVRAGWHDGEWLRVLEHAEDGDGNLPGPRVYLDPANRALQRLISDIDDIYYGGNRQIGKPAGELRVPSAQRFAAEGGDLEEALGKCCYWCAINKPYKPWFVENILDRPDEHIARPQMGLMMFFE
jgi:hypothetical protein